VGTPHTLPCWRFVMDASPEIRVTLSGELLRHLRELSIQKRIPLRWLVAGLVCDTFELNSTKPGCDALALAGNA
jgi:hypothetical protein